MITLEIAIKYKEVKESLIILGNIVLYLKIENMEKTMKFNFKLALFYEELFEFK